MMQEEKAKQNKRVVCGAVIKYESGGESLSGDFIQPFAATRTVEDGARVRQRPDLLLGFFTHAGHGLNQLW